RSCSPTWGTSPPSAPTRGARCTSWSSRPGCSTGSSPPADRSRHRRVELLEVLGGLEVLLDPALDDRGGLLDLLELADHLAHRVEGDVDGLVGVAVGRRDG